MKQKFFLTALLLVAILSVTKAQVPNYVPTNGLVGWWPFNGNANDESGNGNNGTPSLGVILSNDRYNINNKAFDFNGTGNISLNNLPTTGGQDFTITGWIKTNNLINTKGIVCWGQDSPWQSTYFFVTNSGYLKFDFAYNGGPQSPIFISDNIWHFVGVTCNNGLIQLYLDGLTTASPLQMSPNIAGSNKSIGACITNSANNNFSGLLDDIGIWNRALTAQEITVLYQAQSCPKHSVTVTATGTTTFCAGGSVGLNATSVGGYNYQWYNSGSAISGSTGMSFTANQNGLYKVIIDSSGCYDTSNVISVTVNPNPTVSLAALSPYINISSNNVTLVGTPSGGTYSGAGVTSNILNLNSAGLGYKTITYNYTNGNGCSGSATQHTTIFDTVGCTQTIYVYDTITTYLAVTDTLIINAVLTGVPQPNNINTIKVFPNPAKDHLTINFGNYNSMNGYSVKIMNSLAQVVYSSLINQQQVSIDLSTWSGKGTYILNILNNAGAVIETRKIVLQ